MKLSKKVMLVALFAIIAFSMVFVGCSKKETKTEAVAFKGKQPIVTLEAPAIPEENDGISFKGGAPKKPGFFSKITDAIGEFMAKLYKVIKEDTSLLEANEEWNKSW